MRGTPTSHAIHGSGGKADSPGMSNERAGLERLRVLIGHTRSRFAGERLFMVLGTADRPRLPQDAIETQRIPIFVAPDDRHADAR
jgi:hypothetical protein